MSMEYGFRIKEKAAVVKHERDPGWYEIGYPEASRKTGASLFSDKKLKKYYFGTVAPSIFYEPIGSPPADLVFEYSGLLKHVRVFRGAEQICPPVRVK